MNIILEITIIVLIVLLIYFLIVNNKLIKLNNDVKEAFSTMDVYLKKRWDLIPNIVETVKQHAEYEKNTLKEITEIRSQVAYDNLSTNDKLQKNIKVGKELNKIMLLAEDYPDLKTSESFLKLSEELTNVENEIAQSRKYYNAVIRIYNNKVEMFPSNIVAKLTNRHSKEMFVASEEEKENKEVEL